MNVALGRHEDQNVSRSFQYQLADRVQDGCLHVRLRAAAIGWASVSTRLLILRSGIRIERRPIADLDRVCPA